MSLVRGNLRKRPYKPRKHGLCGSPLYTTWLCMRDRCVNPNNDNYHNYGGRGIAVCERWNSFEAFISDMGSRPEGTSLDRIDVNKNYEPSNCRWATQEVQHNNTRRTVFLEFNGETLSIAQWAKKTGIHRAILRTRLNYGWPLAQAFTTQPSKNTPRMARGTR